MKKLAEEAFNGYNLQDEREYNRQRRQKRKCSNANTRIISERNLIFVGSKLAECRLMQSGKQFDQREGKFERRDNAGKDESSKRKFI